MITVRNRLAITKKCIVALKQHSKLSNNQIYIYDNLSNYKIIEHFEYFCKLYKKNLISQVTFNTGESTFNAFSKAAACNQFGRLHEDDPGKDMFDFLVFLDNDVIVTPGWDEALRQAWRDVKRHKMKHIKVIGQLPGGIKQKKEIGPQIAEGKAKIGKLGGSGLWSVRPDFFRDVGFIDLRKLVGHDKKHDQEYWRLMEKASGGKPYILGLKKKLGVHCGPCTGSVCNILTKNRGNKDLDEKIKFKAQEERIDSMSFADFYKWITDTQAYDQNW